MKAKCFRTIVGTDNSLEVQKMNCLNCGNPIPEEAKFCPVCGTPVPTDSVAEAVAEPVVEAEAAPAVQDAPTESWYQSSAQQNVPPVTPVFVSSKPTIGNEYYTIPEVATHYSISQQAIRKACKEKRLPYKESSGKNKYLISKADMELYISHAKGKKSFNNGVLDT